MKNLEQAKRALSKLLAPKEGWEFWAAQGPRHAEWVAEDMEEAAAKARRVLELAAEATHREVPTVLMPEPLVAALRSVSDAPAVYWLLDLVGEGLAISDALAITEALGLYQIEEDEVRGQRPWPWAQWEVTGGELVWATGSGRSVFTFSPAGGSLERFSEGGDQPTGEWVFGPSGLEEGWVSPEDDRAQQLTFHLGGLSLSPQDSEQVELFELSWAAQDLAALSHATWGRRKKRPAQRRPGRAAASRNRTVKRRADRRRKARDTWDRPVV